MADFNCVTRARPDVLDLFGHAAQEIQRKLIGRLVVGVALTFAYLYTE
jgi:hypothetical protein